MFDKFCSLGVATTLMALSWSLSVLMPSNPFSYSAPTRHRRGGGSRSRWSTDTQSLAADFEVTDDGDLRRILDFRNDVSPVSVGLLLDSSGSMRIGERSNGQARLAIFCWRR